MTALFSRARIGLIELPPDFSAGYATIYAYQEDDKGNRG